MRCYELGLCDMISIIQLLLLVSRLDTLDSRSRYFSIYDTDLVTVAFIGPSVLLLANDFLHEFLILLLPVGLDACDFCAGLVTCRVKALLAGETVEAGKDTEG